MVEEEWDVHKRAFQGLKRTFMHVSGLLYHIPIKKPNYQVFGFIYQNIMGEDLKHA